VRFKGKRVDLMVAGTVTDRWGKPITHTRNFWSPDRIAMAREEGARRLYCALVRGLAAELEPAEVLAANKSDVAEPASNGCM
jgi:hypothetical protein